MKSVVVFPVAMAVLALALGACNRDRGHGRERPGTISATETKDPNEQDKSGTTTLTGASWVANDPAIGLPRVTTMSAVAMRPANEVGVRFHTTSTRLPPPARGWMVAETRLPGAQKLLSRTVHVIVEGSDQSYSSTAQNEFPGILLPSLTRAVVAPTE